MSDTDDTGGSSVMQSLASWGLTAYSIAGWAVDAAAQRLLNITGSAAPPPDPSPSAMENFKATLAPRPANTNAPANATAQETQTINAAFVELTTYVDDNIDSEDISVAREKLAAVVKLVGDTAQAADDRDALAVKKTALEQDLKKIPFLRDVTAAEMRDFAKRRTLIARQISAAAVLSDLDPVEITLETLKGDVSDAQKMIPLRKNASDQIAAAKSARKDMQKTVDRGYYEALNKAISDAQIALGAAKTQTDITQLQAALKAVTDKEADARSYAAYFDLWSVKAEGYLSVYDRDPDKDNRSDGRKARNAAAQAAAVKSKALDFVGARAALDGFETAPAVTANGNYPAASAFMAQLDGFLKSHGTKRQQVKSAKLPWSNRMDNDLSDIRKKGIVNKNWGDAATDLTEHQDKVDKLYPIALKHLQVFEAKGSVPDSDEPMVTLLAAVSASKSKLDNDGKGNYAEALSAFDGLGGAKVNQATALRRLSAIKKRAKAAGTGGFAAAQAHVEGQYGYIKNNIAADIDAANATMDTLEALLDNLEAMIPVLSEARAAKPTHDPTDTFKLLDAAEAKVTSLEFDKAKGEAETALLAYGLLAEFLFVEGQVQMLLATQTDKTPGHTLVKTALSEADDMARTQGKIADAIAKLNAILADPTLAEMAHEAGLWLAKFKDVEKRHNKIVPGMKPDQAKATMTTLFDAAKDKAETDHDYTAAMALLEAYDTKLTQARDYVACRRRAFAVKTALDRAATTFASEPDIDKKVYGDGGKAGIEAQVKAAEDKAVAGKVVEAGADFAQRLKDWKPLLKNIALLHESADSVGSNAGHSIDRHGPEVTDEELLTRLTTGVAPDGKSSPTRNASRYDSFAAWVQAREEGAALLEKENHPGPPEVPVRASDTSIPAAADTVTSMKKIIDHEGPIDRAMRGIKPNQEVDASKGKVGKGQTYETYEALDGITKSETLWLFEIDISAIESKLAKPHGPLEKDVGVKWDSKPQTYIDVHATLPGSPPAPASIPGKWVMMQLFPVVDKWDQEKQDYA
ncbi:hypothetical protein GV827_20905 [Sulfitobacter sp. JBTF-M27]|uniref:Uncharacterized protein n=1 Tax=Sulfitobacter sediminilitoris TaxID=2698830 RepID=A0A6P0CK62_9RHOB|nr:hypothetical protein [Sulfitobacter sediminilitoris]NEK24834.1 hypothetical protein [Sulfitobacter sediminilitoris]